MPRRSYNLGNRETVARLSESTGLLSRWECDLIHFQRRCYFSKKDVRWFELEAFFRRHPGHDMGVIKDLLIDNRMTLGCLLNARIRSPGR